jgi:hypothetical protein
MCPQACKLQYQETLMQVAGAREQRALKPPVRSVSEQLYNAEQEAFYGSPQTYDASDAVVYMRGGPVMRARSVARA